jgi:hypothetical protein
MQGDRTRHVTTLVGGALAVALLALTPLGAAAKDGDVITQGGCSMSTDWKLKLSEEDGRIEVEFEVDQNQNGVPWSVRLKRNGTAFWSGQRSTRGPSGSFEVRKVITDGAGADRIVARATYAGEVCRGSASYDA